MNLFKKLKQTFCRHYWISIKLIDANIYNKDNVRYARCHSVCDKCGKVQDVDFLMRPELQVRLNTQNKIFKR